MTKNTRRRRRRPPFKAQETDSVGALGTVWGRSMRISGDLAALTIMLLILLALAGDAQAVSSNSYATDLNQESVDAPFVS